MTKQLINVGQAANDRSGDPLRTAFNKVNENFTELYDAVTSGVNFNQVNADWNAVSGVANILNKPNIPSIAGLASETYVNTAISNIPPVDLTGYALTSQIPDVSNFVTAEDIPTDVSDLTDTTNLLGQGGGNSDRLVSGDVALILAPTGTLSTPLLLPKTFTAVLDEAHYIEEPGIALTGEPWEFIVEFQVNPNGTVQTMIGNITPWITNPGYIDGLEFTYTEADHGIPGYTFTLTLDNVVFTGGVHWTTNLQASIPPVYPSTVKSLGAIKLTADDSNFVFGTDGRLTIGSATYSTNGLEVTGADAQLASLTDNVSISTNVLVGDTKTWTFRNDGVLQLPGPDFISWIYQDEVGLSLQVDGYPFKFGKDGKLTLPLSGDIVDNDGNSVLGATARSITQVIDNDATINTSKNITTNNLYTNPTNFTSDLDPGLGYVLPGLGQRNETEIEVDLFVESFGAFYTYLLALPLGRTVIATYSTVSGNQTFTSTISQTFGAVGQFDPLTGWGRVAGRILGTVPEGYTGLVSINFSEYSTQSHTWSFGDNGNLTLPTGGDILDSNGNSVLGGLGSITVPAVEGTTYKGLQVSYAMIHSNYNSYEYNVNKIVIHQPVTVDITMDESTNSDDFRVSNLSDSEVIAMFIVYGDVNGPKSVATLQAFAEAAIDTVILGEGQEGVFNTVDVMKTQFAANYQILASAANGLYADFEFYSFNTNFGVIYAPTQLQGTGFVFDIVSAAEGMTVTPTTAGTGYAQGNKILVDWTEYGASDGRYNILVTVGTVDENGGVLTATAEPEIPGFVYSYATWTGLVGANKLGSNFGVYNISYNLTDDTLEINGWSGGSSYYVGDRFKILGTDIRDGNNNPLASPANDLIITVTTVEVNGAVTTFTVSGTLPRPSGSWPNNNINDGGADQYDGANYISTNLASEISYNSGDTVSDGTAFGEGATYSFAYEDSIFALFVRDNTANYVETSGGSGADGDSIAQYGTIYDPGTPEQTFDNAVTHLNIVGGDEVDGIRFSDGTVLTSADGVGRVKLTSPGSRRIEEASGYKSVTVSGRNEQYLNGVSGQTTTAYEIYVKRTLELDAIFLPIQAGTVAATISISFNGNTFNLGYISGYNDTLYTFYFNNAVSPTAQTEDAPVTIRVDTGGTPVVWWDQSDLPGGGDDFRGAVIDYHAYTGEATWVGTIHIANDDGDDNIAHTEVSSGSTDSENDDLWFRDNESQIKYRRIDGESKTLKIQWTARVFYGSETYD